jgi:SAM-dependent methyltransferase
MKEVERITHVYGQYRDDPGIQAQWRADNPGNRAILQERQREMRRALQAGGLWPLTEHRILDVGCGSGRVLAGLLDWGAAAENLAGVDLLPHRIRQAQQNYPHLHFQCSNAEQLPFADAAFDLLLVFTVFSSILDQAMAANVAAEMARVLAPDGAILWYDFRFNNPRNPHVCGMTRAYIRQLFPHFALQLGTITLLPPLARRLGRLTPLLYPVLVRLPWLRTHYLGLLKKRSTING